MAIDGISYEIHIIGKCKSSVCGNTFVGTATKNPDDPGGLMIAVETRDTQEEEHEQVRRPLNGKRRKEVQKELITEGSSVWRKRMARENMVLGDSVPPHLPNPDVARQAKKEAADALLNVKPTDARDLIRTIEDLGADPDYRDLIKQVGSLPFFVFYGMPSQLHVYREYCGVFRNRSVITVDSTGSLVTRLERPGKNKTGHIFLYSVVINFENTTIPVYQMITEKHETEFIQYWLQQWIRSGAPKPTEAVCDYARALLSGLCMTFNNITIKSYINICFESVQPTRTALKNLSTFIRVDVAHLTHAVYRWKCFKTNKQAAIKDLFVRCVSLMVDCQNFETFREVFTLTCTVGLQEHEDAQNNYPGVRVTQEARKKLERYIAVRQITTVWELEEEEVGDNDGETVASDVEDIDDATSNIGAPIVQWVENHVAQARKVVRAGVDFNPFYFPDFIESLSRIAKEFPLWTGVALPYMAPHATSSYVEGYFNDLKTRVFKDSTLPLRVDKFLKIHANDIIGGILLSTADLKNVKNKAGTMINLPLKQVVENIDSSSIGKSIIEFEPAANDSDLLSQENWRGKAPMMNIENQANDIDSHVEGETLSSQLQISLDVSISSSFETADLINFDDNTSFTDHLYSMVSETSPLPSPVEDNETRSREDLQNNNNIGTGIEANKRKTTKTSKFYEPFPEIQRANLLTSKTRKPSILPNGSSCSRSLTIDNKTYFVRFTCAFDSLAHILMTSAIDDIHYASFLEQSKNSTLKLVSTLVNNGVTPGILHQRAVILKGFCPSLPAVCTALRVISYTINAWDSIARVVTKTMKSAPSVYETRTCSHCQIHQRTAPLMTVNHGRITKEGFGILEKALSYRPTILKVRCYKPCTGHYTLTNRPNIHIFIELDIRATGPNMPVAKQGMESKLEQLPMKIRIALDEASYIEYRLVGVVGFRQKHYTAYCIRNNGTWQVYDNYQTRITTCRPDTIIEPHLAVYVRQFGDRCDMKNAYVRLAGQDNHKKTSQWSSMHKNLGRSRKKFKKKSRR